jgi:hypothetical protein
MLMLQKINISEWVTSVESAIFINLFWVYIYLQFAIKNMAVCSLLLQLRDLICLDCQS